MPEISEDRANTVGGACTVARDHPLLGVVCGTRSISFPVDFQMGGFS